jgi:uncharacterized protein (DUF1778 family)
MSKEKTINFRVSSDERAMIEAIAKRLGKTQSDAMRTMIREFGMALGITPGKAVIRVKVETVEELPY